jgi:hypothetical protein
MYGHETYSYKYETMKDGLDRKQRVRIREDMKE